MCVHTVHVEENNIERFYTQKFPTPDTRHLTQDAPSCADNLLYCAVLISAEHMNTGYSFNDTRNRLRLHGTLPQSHPYSGFQPWGTDHQDTFDYTRLLTYSRNGTPLLDPMKTAEYLRSLWYLTMDGGWYRFNGCYYEEITSDDLEAEIQKILSELELNPQNICSIKKNVISAWKDSSDFKDIPIPESFDPTPYEGCVYPCLNGVYNLVEDKLYPFTPYMFFDSMMNVYYDPKEHHPAEKVYEQIFPDPGTRRVFFEAVGFTFFAQDMHPASIFVTLGGGGTGKSTVFGIMSEIIGHRFVIGMSPLDLSDKFGPVNLIGKKANLCTEAARESGDRRHVSSNVLKKLAAGDLISVDKKYEASQSFCNRAKLWFAANNLPDLGLNDSGVMRRVHIFPMLNTDWVSDEAICDLHSEEGKSWLFFTALKAYVGFILSGAGTFEDSNQMLAYKSDLNMSDSFIAFFVTRYGTYNAEELRTILCDGEPIYSDELYGEYLESVSDYFPQQKGMARNMFGTRLRTELRISTYSKKVWQPDGKRVERSLLIRDV